MRIFHPVRMSALAVLLFLSQFSKADPYKDSVIVNLGLTIDSLIYNGYGKGFDNYIDMNAFCDRFLIEKEGDDKLRKFNLFFKLGVTSRFNLGQEIVSSTEAGGIYTFLSYYEEDDHYILVFRLFSADGLNYHLLR